MLLSWEKKNKNQLLGKTRQTTTTTKTFTAIRLYQTSTLTEKSDEVWQFSIYVLEVNEITHSEVT